MKILGWLMLVVLFAGGIAMFRAIPASSPPQEASWRQEGRSGDMFFVTLSKPEPKGSVVYNDAAKALCANKTACQVLYWPPGYSYPRSLPMNDAQLAGQVAQFKQNTLIGLSQMLWSCEKFPDAPSDQCFSR